jgi:hypothetical protein
MEDLRLLLALDRRGDSQARGQESGGARHAESKGREQELHDDEGGGECGVLCVFWVPGCVWRRRGGEKGEKRGQGALQLL